MSPRKLIYITGLIIAVIAGAVILFSRSDISSGAIAASAGYSATTTPSFTLQDLDGNSVSLSDYQGKVVLINFWAHWCPPCIREIPDMIRLREDYKDKNFEVLGVVVPTRYNESRVRRMVSNFKMTYPVLIGTEESLAQFGTINSIPRTFILDTKGEIREDILGASDYAMFEQMIKKYLP